MMKLDRCNVCGCAPGSLYLDDNQWLCKTCYQKPYEERPYVKEMGVENPYDTKGSTAHVRDIKNRRLDPKTKKMFYYQPPKTYFFPKG